jgi:hypothetical protein
MVVEERKSSAAAAGLEADGQNQNGKWKKMWRQASKISSTFPPIFMSHS